MNLLIKKQNKIKFLLFTFLISFIYRSTLYYFQIFDTWGLTDDSLEYINIAKSIKEFGIIGENGEPGMNRTPGYPFFIYFSFLFSENLNSIIFTQFFIDSLSCVLIMDIASGLKISNKLKYFLSFLLISCLYTTIYSGLIMTETLYCFLITLSFWIICKNHNKKEFFFDLPNYNLIFLSFVYAAIIYVRPIFSLILLITFIIFFCIDLFNSKNFNLKIISKYFIISSMVLIFLSPWILRNNIVFKKYYELPNNDIITPIGFKSNINKWKVIYNKNYQKFVKSYNEPLLILNPIEKPKVYKSVYNGENKDIDEAFRLLQKIPDIRYGVSNYPIKYPEEMNNKFLEISEKRYQHSPSLYFTAPLSRIAKILFAPRISSFYKNKSGFNSNKITFIFYTIYNLIYTLPSIILCAFGIIFFKKYRYNKIFLYSFSLIIGHLYVYTSWVPLTQSRYLIPMFPILSLLSIIFFNKLYLNVNKYFK